jgi:carboxymethylenebutenolidase
MTMTDGLGIRPAMLEIGERLSTYGYFVLLADLYYRFGPYAPMDARVIFSDPAKIKELREMFFPHASPDKILADTGAFLAWLDGQPDVKPGGIATTGYTCSHRR